LRYDTIKQGNFGLAVIAPNFATLVGFIIKLRSNKNFMRTLLFPIRKFKSKDVDYIACNGVTESGEAVEIFTSQKDADEKGYDFKNALTKEDVEEIFKTYKVAEVELGMRSRVLKVK
jgi:hypothetical protein